jgi:hypothetical protein
MSKSQTKAGAAAALEGEIKVRLLVDCDLGKCNDVVTIDAVQLEALAGVADADPAAVEYAESTAKE